MARVPYLDPEDLPAEYREQLYSSADSERTANVFRALANNSPLLDSFRKYFGYLWAESGLTEREREAVILAVARESGSTYEWHQHVRLGRAAGLDDEEIRAIGAGDLDALSGREALLVRYALATLRGDVDDDLFEAAVVEFDDSTLVGTALLAAGYYGLARVLDALDMDLEEEFVGWDLAGG